MRLIFEYFKVQFWIKQVLDGGIDGMKKDFAICDEMQKNELYHGTLDDERNRYRVSGSILIKILLKSAATLELPLL